MWQNITSPTSVHVLPVMPGEPKHPESETCWCKPRVERHSKRRLVVHRCWTRPEENTDGRQVEVS